MATRIENDLNTDLFPATGDFLSAVHVGEKDYKIKDLAARKDILSVAHQVDINTGDYVEFNSDGRSEDLQLQRSGPDFFV